MLQLYISLFTYLFIYLFIINLCIHVGNAGLNQASLKQNSPAQNQTDGDIPS